MVTRLITCNRDWTGITVKDKNGKNVYLSYNDIDEIIMGYYTESKLFVKRTTEKIEVRVKGRKDPIILTKAMDWDRFEQYKKEVIKFANDNKIPLITFD